MEMLGKIWRLHGRKNKSEREISRITGLSRNTVSKWLHGEVDARRSTDATSNRPSSRSSTRRSNKHFSADARRPRHEQRAVMALYAEIRAAGYDGGYPRVTKFIRA